MALRAHASLVIVGCAHNWDVVIGECVPVWRGSCVAFVGLLVGFQWPVNNSVKIGVLEAQDDVVVGVV